MYDEAEVTLHAACSIHELFLLNLDEFSFKSSYLNHALLLLERTWKKNKLDSVIKGFYKIGSYQCKIDSLYTVYFIKHIIGNRGCVLIWIL